MIHSLEEIYQRTLEQVEPARLMARQVYRQGDELQVGPYRLPCRRVWLLGAGKAVLAMARPLALILGGNLVGGVLLAPPAQHNLANLEVLAAEHPIPGSGSYRGAQRLLHCARAIPRQDTLLFLLSGGASSLMEMPRPGISLEQIQELYTALLACGAPIEELNRIRQAFSHVKAGGLLPHLPPNTITLLLNDIPGGKAALVGSGPTMRETGGEDVPLLLERYRIAQHLSWDPLRRLAPRRPEGNEPPHVVLGDVTTLVEAAQEIGSALGMSVLPYPELVRGEAHLMGRALAEFASRNPGRLIVAGGECTVNVTGTGRGGRCQEMVLGFALGARGKNLTMLAAGSDGRDGPTEAAGAWSDGETFAKAESQAFDLEEVLAHNDAFTCLQSLGQILPRAQTLNNLNDLILIH